MARTTPHNLMLPARANPRDERLPSWRGGVMEHVFEPVGAMKRRSRHDVEADLEKDPVLEEIGQKIQALRRHKKWKQADLAEHAGIQTVTVFAAESGLQNLTVKTLTKIAGALGVEI